MSSLSTAWKLARDLGPSWILKRTKFEAEAHFGILERRLPVSNWDFDSRDWLSAEAPLDAERFKHSVAERSRFLFSFATAPSLLDCENVCRQADRILSGEWPFFSHHWLRIGFPPDWHLNALDGERVDDRVHWSRLDLAAIHDVKFVWEPNRFSVVYVFARAYGARQDERYAEGFWKLIEDWASKNPPNQGVNWASGQEAAFRAMAWCFGLFSFFSSPSSTPERVFKLVRMIEKHGERLAGFIEYAISQRNNHGISEAGGLFTIGILFPQLRRAREWLESGRQLIIRQIQEQIDDDGSYVQHSFNYERLMLDDVVWAFRLGELNEQCFPSDSYELVAKAARFMLRFCDQKTGRMPNCGGNDGSLALPLSSSDYTDFRPSIQAAYYLTHREFCYGTGAWNEMAERFFRGDTGSATSKLSAAIRTNSNLRTEQYLKVEARESYCMLRAARYRDRPAHADQLHLDLWWRGENVACDPGTYLYNGAAPWTNALARTEVHNTVTVANRDQMTRAGRFLWLDWAQADCLSYKVERLGTAVEASHNGYRRLGVVHRRSILSLPNTDAYIVVDDILGEFFGNVRLHWLFPDYPFTWQEQSSTLILKTPPGEFQCVSWAQQHLTTIARAGEIVAGIPSPASNSEMEIRGWRSLYYGEKEPAISLVIETRTQLPVRFVTVLAPEEVSVLNINDQCLKMESRETSLSIAFRQPAGEGQIFSNA